MHESDLEIQKEIKTYTGSNGSITAEFRRYGNCISIELEVKTIGSNMLSIGGNDIPLPNWAKVDQSNSRKIYGEAYVLKDIRINGSSIQKSEAEFSIDVNNSGVSHLVGNAVNQNASSSTSETGFHLTMNYIVD